MFPFDDVIMSTGACIASLYVIMCDFVGGSVAQKVVHGSFSSNF